ncbi:hypothetical protein NFI96_007873 [Prochilodus magdalenae]|nr:hypothetical protein NFI96_007873 [Prochilodus magdalenae]
MFDSLANHTISRYIINHLGTLNGLGRERSRIRTCGLLLIAVGLVDGECREPPRVSTLHRLRYIATTGEEAKSPNTSIPYAIITPRSSLCLTA